MDLVQTVKIAFRALRTNKMRSFLTMLGIIIGIAAVIAVVAVGAGARYMISRQIASMGSSLILVVPGSGSAGGMRMGSGSVQTLTMDDARAIGDECSSVHCAAPVVRGNAQVVYGNMNWSTPVMGVTPEFLEVREWNLLDGRGISRSDNDAGTKNCLIGSTVASNLFGGDDPLGKVIRIKKTPFTVVGVLESKGQSPQGIDQDDIVLVPLKTAQARVFPNRFPGTVASIMVKAKSDSAMADAETEITGLLRQRHRIVGDKEPDFTVRNLSEMMAVAEQSSKVLSLLLAAVASISLLVGGIGIMNIMLVSVTERTREIGIRMAIGARRKDILVQFLIEAVLLTVTGGAIGIAIGVGGGKIISALFDTPTLTSIEAVIAAVTFSGGIGVFFGLYPARKASNLNPIDALRYE